MLFTPCRALAKLKRDIKIMRPGHHHDFSGLTRIPGHLWIHISGCLCRPQGGDVPHIGRKKCFVPFGDKRNLDAVCVLIAQSIWRMIVQRNSTTAKFTKWPPCFAMNILAEFVAILDKSALIGCWHPLNHQIKFFAADRIINPQHFGLPNNRLWHGHAQM